MEIVSFKTGWQAGASGLAKQSSFKSERDRVAYEKGFVEGERALDRAMKMAPRLLEHLIQSDL